MATPKEPKKSSALMFLPRAVELKLLRAGAKKVAGIPNSRVIARDVAARCKSSPLVVPADHQVRPREDSVKTNPRVRGTESLKRRFGMVMDYIEDRADVSSGLHQEPKFASTKEQTNAVTGLPALHWPELPPRISDGRNDTFVRNLATATEQVQAAADTLTRQRRRRFRKFSETRIDGTLLRELAAVTRELDAMAGLAAPERQNVSNYGKDVGSSKSLLQEFAPTDRIQPSPVDPSFCSDVNQLHGVAAKFKVEEATGSLDDSLYAGTARRRRHFSYGSTDARQIDSLAQRLATVTAQVQAVADVVAPRRLRHSDEVVLASLRGRLLGLSPEKRVIAEAKIEDVLRHI